MEQTNSTATYNMEKIGMSKASKEKVQEALRRIADLEVEIHREARKLISLEPDAGRRSEIAHQRDEIRRAIHEAVVKVKEWNERENKK